MMIIKIFAFFVTAILFVLLTSFAEYFVGRVLLVFPATQYAGLKLLAMSGLFSDSVPKYCPKLGTCEKCECGNWTCPLYGSSHVEHHKQQNK